MSDQCGKLITMHLQLSHANHRSNATIAFVCGVNAVTIPETLS
jgi:hypothetical protein